jgi:nicotinate phosphoribosyltransferase
MGVRGLLTDQYELTMLRAALGDGTATRHVAFEVFPRLLPPGRRYGVLAGTARLVAALEDFRFDDAQLAALVRADVIDTATAEWLAAYRFGGDIDGYREGEVYFPGAPLLTVQGTFAECVLLETITLSVLNHDSAVAAASARMVSAAAGRPLVDMGSRRTHEDAAIAAARAAYLTGFASTSNLAAGERYGIPTSGTVAHAFIVLHDDETAAFRSQVDALGPSTTLLVDTYDIDAGLRHAIEAAGPKLGAVRIDSGDLAAHAHRARALLDELGATDTKIVLSSDLDEYAIAALTSTPVDSYGVGTSLVTGSGAPTAGLIYKLVEVDGRRVAKTSEGGKATVGGRKTAIRRHHATGIAAADVVSADPIAAQPGDRSLQVPYVRNGAPVTGLPSLTEIRDHHHAVMGTMPWAARTLSPGGPALPVRQA